MTGTSLLQRSHITEDQPPWSRFASRIFAPLLFSCGLIVAVIAAWLIVIGYSPTPFADQWGIIYELASGRHWYSPVWLWSQSNEHRCPLVRLAVVADLKWLGGHSILVFGLIYTTLLLHWTAWAIYIRKAIDVSRSEWLTVTGFFAFCLFCPTQIENFYWALQLTFVAAFLFSSLSFLSLAWFSARGRGWMAVVLASLFAFASESSLASGIVTWPVLWLAATRQLLFTKRQRLTLLIVGVTSIALYFYHYQRPAAHSNPLSTIRQPGRILQYVGAYIGHPLSHFVTYPRFAAVVLSLLALSALWYLFRHNSTRNLGLVLAMTMSSVLGTAGITALGRLKFGIAQAEASRYQTPVMLYWACAFAALFIAAHKLSLWRDVLTLNLLAAAVILLPLRELKPMADFVRARANLLSSIGESLDQGALDPPAQANLIAGMFAVEPDMPYLHALGDRLVPVPSQISSGNLHKQPWGPGVCDGQFTLLTPLSRFFPGEKAFRAAGWAVDSRHHSEVSAVALIDDRGHLIAGTAQHLPLPPDVQNAHPSAQGPLAWRIYASVPPTVTNLRAVAIVSGRPCPLSGSQPR